jgi:hypothetical protein
VTLIRLIRTLPEPAVAQAPQHSYGTPQIDVETRQPVDILPERPAERVPPGSPSWRGADPPGQSRGRDETVLRAASTSRMAWTSHKYADGVHVQ